MATKPRYQILRGTSPTAAALNPNSAAGRVDAVLAPQLAQQAAYGEHQNAVIQAFANSLLGKLQPIAGQVGADYDQAIQQIGGLSGQAAGFLSGQNPAAAQQQLLSSVNAPASQQAQQAQQLSDTFQGGAGVLAYTGGTIPGSQMAGNKAAAQSFARTLPAIGALKGQQDLSSALWQQSQNRMTLESTRPGLVQDAQAQIDETNRQNAQLALQRQEAAQRERAAQATANYRQGQLDLGYAKAAQSAYDKKAARAETAAYHDAYLGHLQAGDREDVAHNKALEAAAVTRNKISAANAETSRRNSETSRINARTSQRRASQAAAPRTEIVGSDKSGRRLINSDTGEVIKVITPPRPGTTKGVGAKFTALQVQKYRGLAATIAAQAREGFVDDDDVEHPPLSFEEALSEMRKEGIPESLALAELYRVYPNSRPPTRAAIAAGTRIRSLPR